MARLDKQQASSAADENSVSLCSAALDAPCTSQAHCARSQNGPHSRAMTLSPEIWAIIWSMLEMNELLRITHVCSHWRSVALGSACLWSRVSFNTIICDMDSPTYVKDCPCWDDPELHHDLSKLKEFLYRSKGAALSAKLTIHPSCEYDLLARDIAAAFQPHSHRLQSIKFVCGDPGFSAEFLCHIKELPSLASLRYGSKMLRDWTSAPRWTLDSLRLDELSLPRLSQLYIPDFLALDAFELLDLPQLRILTCSIDDTQTLLSILSRLPGLVTLELGIAEHNEAPDVPSSAAFDGLAPLLAAVTFQNVTLGWEPILAPLLRRPSLQSASLVYRDPDETNHVSLGDLFAPLDDDLRLELCFSYGFCVKASDSLGLRRSFTLARNIMLFPSSSLLWFAWKHLRIDTLRRLTLEWCDRGGLLHPSIVAPQLERLCLIVPSLPDWLRNPFPDSDPCGDLPPSCRPDLPRLQHIVIAAENGLPRCIVSRALIRSFTSAISERMVSVELSDVEVVP